MEEFIIFVIILQKVILPRKEAKPSQNRANCRTTTDFNRSSTS